MKIFSILLLVTTLSACSLFEEDDITRPVSIDLIIVNNNAGLRCNFTAIPNCGSMCWKDTYDKSIISGQDVYIKAFSVSDGSASCSDACVETEIPISIQLKVPGSYTFHFWKSDTSSIDTTLILGM